MSYYDILEIAEHASSEVISAAYRRLAQKYHPDVDPDPDAAKRMTALNEAHAVLSDPERRREYDREQAARIEKSSSYGRESSDGGLESSTRKSAAKSLRKQSDPRRPRGANARGNGGQGRGQPAPVSSQAGAGGLQVFRHTWWALGQLYYELAGLGFKVNGLWFLTVLPFLAFMVVIVINPLLVTADFMLRGVGPPVSPLLQFLVTVGGTVVLSVLAGPGTAALFALTNQFIEGENMGARPFFRAFRQFFWKGWITLMIDLFILYGLVMGFVFYTGTGQLVIQALGFLSLYLIVLWVAAQAYVFSLVVRYDLAPHHALRNAAVMALSSFLPSLAFVIVALLTAAVSVLFLFPLVVMSGSTLALVGHRVTEDRLKAFGIDPSKPA